MSGRLLSVQVITGTYTPSPGMKLIVVKSVASSGGGSGGYYTGVIKTVGSGGTGGRGLGPKP